MTLLPNRIDEQIGEALQETDEKLRDAGIEDRYHLVPTAAALIILLAVVLVMSETARNLVLQVIP